MKRAFSLVELLVVVAIFLILAAILFPVYRQIKYNQTVGSCQSNLKQIGLCFIQYEQDYGKFPRVRVHDVASSLMPHTQPFGWADALYVYSKSDQLLHCVQSYGARSTETDAAKLGYSDYWMNSRLSGAFQQNISPTALTILAGDGKDANGNLSGDARYAISALPQSWRDEEKSPARRHLDTANYLFADGHVKAFKPSAIQNSAPPSLGKPTFRSGENGSLAP